MALESMPYERPPTGRIPRNVLRLLWRGVRRKKARLVRGSAIASYLASHEVRKLHIGAGHNLLPGWLNTDRNPSTGAVYLDATEPFPFEEETFDYVFSEHLIEHLSYRSGVAMLKECHRVLKPGGAIRIATPDLERIVSLKRAFPGSVQERYARWLAKSYYPSAAEGNWSAYAINQAFRGWGHQFLYDRETLQAVLERVRFVGVRPQPFGQSDDENLARVEGHGSDGNRKMSEFETMILEATRP